MQKQIKATVTENPKLKTKVLSDGNLSLYLDYYLGRVIVYDEALDREVSKVQRKREFLYPQSPVSSIRKIQKQPVPKCRPVYGRLSVVPAIHRIKQPAISSSDSLPSFAIRIPSPLPAFMPEPIRICQILSSHKS